MRKSAIQTTPKLRVAVLTLFPDMFPGPLDHSIAAKARADNIWAIDVIDMRDFAQGKHRTVDDTPFGGGAGMVIRADVIDAAIQSVHARQGFENAPVIYFTPRGKTFCQKMAREFSTQGNMILLCGRYEGIDERVIEKHRMVEISMGDFILSGGEIPALTLLDAVIRLLPGTVGAPQSLVEESFETGLLEAPHYTKPAEWQGMPVPEILLSGHHQKIADWRKDMAKSMTQQRRPDLWEKYGS